MSKDKEKDPLEAKGDNLAKAKMEPSPKREDFFQWLESLYEGAQFPEKLHSCVLKGKNYAVFGPTIEHTVFPPTQVKPGKEKLVAESNRLLDKMQRDCDVQRKEIVYGVHAYHFAVTDGFYQRFTLRLKPGATYRLGQDGKEVEDEDGEEDGSMEKRFSVQILHHQKEMMEMFIESHAGFIDRQDRQAQRLYARVDQLETRHEKTMDMLERALSLESQRKREAMWDEFKMRGAEKAMEFGMAMAPPLLNNLIGKSIIPTKDTAETITLRNFFRALEEKLPKEQIAVILGEWNDDGTIDKPGLLSPQQVEVLVRVTRAEATAEALDALMPGEQHQITPEQAMTLQKLLPIEMLMPLFTLFETRRKQKEKK